LLSSGRQTLERRVLRARCLKYFESFDLAWAELNEVLPQVKDPLLEARVAVDLLQLSYYLVRREETPKLSKIAEKHAAGDPLMLAEFYLGNSTVLTAQNEITNALQSARRAEDALLTAPKGRSRDLVVTRVQRQLAHLLSHSGDYVDATAAAEATVRHAARVGDPWEAAWAVYTTGFVDWAAGRIDQAVDQFTKAEASLAHTDRRSGATRASASPAREWSAARSPTATVSQGRARPARRRITRTSRCCVVRPTWRIAS